MRASGRPPYSHRDPSRPGRGGDRSGLSIGALAHRLMSLRASLTRRLAGAPARPSYAIAGTRPAPSWLTAPHAMVGRGPEEALASDGAPARGAGPNGGEPRIVAPQHGDTNAAWAAATAARGWPAEVFDDRASLDMLVSAPRAESRIDAAASSPGVLIRSPRRPAAITPESEVPGLPSAPFTAARPAPAAAEPERPAVRYTRTPDPVLHERRQRALDAERAALAQAQAEAQAATRALEAERAAAERAAQEAAAAASAEPPVPLWRQPFVPPPGVRFFRTPDRRPVKPPAEPAADARAPGIPNPGLPAAAPAPQPVPERDWSEVPDWSDMQPWFEGQDWSAMEAWAAIQAEADKRADSAMTEAGSGRVPDFQAEAASDRFVSIPLDISLLRALPPSPVYVLDRLVRFDGTRLPRPADGQDNGTVQGRGSVIDGQAQELAAPAAARPALSLVFGPGADFASRSEAASVPAAPASRSRPLSAMAARAAIRGVQPPAAAVTLPVRPGSIPAPAAASIPAMPITPRPVLLRGRAAPEAQLPEMPSLEVPSLEVPSLEAPGPGRRPSVQAAPEPVESAAAAPDQTPLPAQAVPVIAPRASLPEPRATLIPAGRHLAVATIQNDDYEHPSLELLAMPEASASEEVDADVLEQNARTSERRCRISACAARSSMSAPARSSPSTSWSRRPASSRRRVIGLADDIARSMSARLGPRRRGARPQRHRHRAAQPEARDRVFARADRLARISRRSSSSWRCASARPSAASRSSPTSPTCRICSSPAPPARASRSPSTP